MIFLAVLGIVVVIATKLLSFATAVVFVLILVKMGGVTWGLFWGLLAGSFFCLVVAIIINEILE